MFFFFQFSLKKCFQWRGKKGKNSLWKNRCPRKCLFLSSASVIQMCSGVLFLHRVRILPLPKSKSLFNDSNVSSGVCLNDQNCPRWVLPWTNHPTVDHKYIPLINSAIWLDWVQPMLSLDWTSGNPGSIWTATLTNDRSGFHNTGSCWRNS